MEDRIERLESMFALQENTIKNLDKVIYDQQKQIDRLESLVETMALKLKSLGDQVHQGMINDMPPPHYGV